MKTIRTGPVMDIFPERGATVVVCEHGKTWPQGDNWERNGGKACEPCSKEAYRILNLRG